MVKKNGSEDLFAMKAIPKSKLKDIADQHHLEAEKNVLQQADCPFIPVLKYHFENDKKVFLVMEYIGGGSLHTIHK